MIKRKRLSKRRKLREKKRLPRNKRAVAREINDPAILHTRFLLHDFCADVVHINERVYLQLKCGNIDMMMFYTGDDDAAMLPDKWAGRHFRECLLVYRIKFQ